MAKVNLLNEWKSEYDVKSSELNPGKIVNRKWVDFIYKIIVETWGDEMFYVDLLEVLGNNSHHFLMPVLTRKTSASFYFLLETAFIIDIIKTDKKNSYFDRFAAVKNNSRQCRELLFEVYVDWVFELNKIRFIPNVLFNNQVKEGYCAIGDQVFLVECKMKYSPLTQQMRIRQFIMTELFKTIRKAKWGFEAIGIIKLKEEKTEQRSLTSTIKQFKNFIVNRTDYSPHYSYEDAHISIRLSPKSNELLGQLQNGTTPFDLYFTLENNHRYEEGKSLFTTKIFFNASVERERIYDKLKDTIKRAKEQHRNDPNPMLLIINNEFIEDFNAPLLSGNEQYERKLQSELDEDTEEIIIVLVYRTFIQEQAKIYTKVLSSPSSLDKSEIIKRLNFTTINFRALNQHYTNLF